MLKLLRELKICKAKYRRGVPSLSRQINRLDPTWSLNDFHIDCIYAVDETFSHAQ